MDPIVYVSVINTDTCKMVAISDKQHTAFAGVVMNETINITVSPTERLNELLIKAVNNRTRERNYFKMYSELLSGDLSDEKFDSEIENNEDDYVLPVGDHVGLNDIELALKVTPQIKGVKSIDDFAALFSFSEDSIRKSIEDKENGGIYK